MMSPAAAPASAARREPAPASLVFVTGGAAAAGLARTSVNSSTPRMGSRRAKPLPLKPEWLAGWSLLGRRLGSRGSARRDGRRGRRRRRRWYLGCGCGGRRAGGRRGRAGVRFLGFLRLGRYREAVLVHLLWQGRTGGGSRATLVEDGAQLHEREQCVLGVERTRLGDRLERRGRVGQKHLETGQAEPRDGVVGLALDGLDEEL